MPQTGTQGEGTGRRWPSPPARREAWEGRSPPCPPLDLGHPPSWTVRTYLPVVWAPVCCSLLGCPSPRRQQAPGLRRFAKQASGATFEGSLRVLTPRGLSSDLNLRAVAKAQTHLPWNHCILVRAGSLPPALQPLGQVCQAPRGILVRKSSLLPLQPPWSEAKSRAAVPSSGVKAMDVVPWARLRQPHLGAVFSGKCRGSGSRGSAPAAAVTGFGLRVCCFGQLSKGSVTL